jgi:hypothetical protein
MESTENKEATFVRLVTLIHEDIEKWSARMADDVPLLNIAH